MKQGEQELALTALRLRAVSPEFWNDFLTALKVHESDVREAMVTSPLELLQIAQGRAQECARLVRLLQEAPQRAEQIEQGKVNARERHR